MALRVRQPRAAIPRTAPDATVVTTIARPTTIATNPFWADLALSRIPPGPGSVGIRGLSPLDPSVQTALRRSRRVPGLAGGVSCHKVCHRFFIDDDRDLQQIVGM